MALNKAIQDGSGSEFRVNTTTDGYQAASGITTFKNGGFIIVWVGRGNDKDGLTVDDFGVFSQRYDKDGNTLGEETLVNTTTKGYQSYPCIVSMSDDSYIITWSGSVDSDATNIYAQRFFADGSANNNEFLVNTPVLAHQAGSSIASFNNNGHANDNGHIVVWAGYGNTNTHGVHAQVFKEDGTKKGAEFSVDSSVAILEYNTQASVTTFDNGSFIITWSDFIKSPDNIYGPDKIYAQIFNPDSTPEGTKIIVSEGASFTQANPASITQKLPSATTIDATSFIITWTSFNYESDASNVFARIYNTNGTPKSDQFLVNTFQAVDQSYAPYVPASASGSVVTPTNDGGFIISWSSHGQDGDSYGVYAQRFDADANKVEVTYKPPLETDGVVEQGTASPDVVTLTAKSDVFYGEAGDDTVTLVASGTWENEFYAKNVGGTNQHANISNLKKFSDVIDGGDGTDTIQLTADADAFFIDDVYSSTHSSLSLSSTLQGINSTARVLNLETINAGDGDDLIDLSSINYAIGNITVNGENGNDIIWSSNGDDVLNGGVGSDTLFGGSGTDTMTGGLGADTFQFSSGSGVDNITDFSIADDNIEIYYTSDEHSSFHYLSLNNNTLTWEATTNTNVVINLQGDSLPTSEQLSELVTFIEIV